MTKGEAIDKYAHLAGLRGLGDVVEALPTLEAMREFWGDIAHISWPENYGQSPWDTAAWIAGLVDSVVTGEPITNPYVLSSEEYWIARAYAAGKGA